MSFGNTFSSLVPESSKYSIDMDAVGDEIESNPTLRAQAEVLSSLSGAGPWEEECGDTDEWKMTAEDQERREAQYLLEQEKEREQEIMRREAGEDNPNLTREDQAGYAREGSVFDEEHLDVEGEKDRDVISEDEGESGLTQTHCVQEENLRKENLKKEFSGGVVTPLEGDAATKKAASVIRGSRVAPKEEPLAAQKVSQSFMTRFRVKGSVDDSTLRKAVVTSAEDKIPAPYRSQARSHLKGLSPDMQTVWAEGFLQGMLAARSKELEKATSDLRLDSKDIRRVLSANENALKTATGMLEQFKIWMDRESRARARTSAAASKPSSPVEDEIVKNGNLLYKVRDGVPVADTFLPVCQRAFWVSLADWVGTGPKSVAKAIVVSETDLEKVPVKMEKSIWKDCMRLDEVQALHHRGEPQGKKSTEAYYKKVFNFWSNMSE